MRTRWAKKCTLFLVVVVVVTRFVFASSISQMNRYIAILFLSVKFFESHKVIVYKIYSHPQSGKHKIYIKFMCISGGMKHTHTHKRKCTHSYMAKKDDTTSNNINKTSASNWINVYTIVCHRQTVAWIESFCNWISKFIWTNFNVENSELEYIWVLTIFCTRMHRMRGRQRFILPGMCKVIVVYLTNKKTFR